MRWWDTFCNGKIKFLLLLPFIGQNHQNSLIRKGKMHLLLLENERWGQRNKNRGGEAVFRRERLFSQFKLELCKECTLLLRKDGWLSLAWISLPDMSCLQVLAVTGMAEPHQIVVAKKIHYNNGEMKSLKISFVFHPLNHSAVNDSPPTCISFLETGKRLFSHDFQGSWGNPCVYSFLCPLLPQLLKSAPRG